MVLVWVVLVVLLLFFEMHHMAFYALFAAVGALAAAVVALFAPDAIGVQAVVAILVSIAGVILVRPYVSTVFHRHRGGQVARGVHGGLVGQEAVTLDEVGSQHSVGHVRLAGERWLAMTEGPPIASGHSVIVTAVRGTTLEVWPVDSLDAPRHQLEPPNTDAPDGADRS